MPAEPVMSKHELRATYGRPTQTDRTAALSVLGLAEQIDPDDVVAFTYPSQEAADAYAASNLAHYGHPTLGTYETPNGVVGVLDLRPALAQHRA